MSDVDERSRAIVWVDAFRAPVVGRIIDRVGETIDVVAVGGPPSSEVDTLATSLGCPRYDDLRRMRIDHPCGVMLAAAEDDGPTALVEQHENPFTLLALEPPWRQLGDLHDANNKARGGRRRAGPVPTSQSTYEPAGSFLSCEGWQRAADPSELLQGVELVRYFSAGPRTSQSLFGRLFEAWHLLLTLTELPRTIDASCSRPISGDDLRSLTGSLSVHVRHSGGICASLDVSDATGASHRQLQAIGPAVELAVGDRGYRLWGATGEVLETQGDPECDTTVPIEDLVAEHWQRTFSRNAAPARAAPLEQVLACCVATQLSARTGEPERPEAILTMEDWSL